MGSRISFAAAQALSRMAGRHGDAVISGTGIVTSLAVAGQRQSFNGGVGIRYTTPDFFRVFDVPLEKGRVWTPAEAENGAPVVVVDAESANDLFHGAPAVGKRLRVGETLYTVIGLTGHWNPQPRYYDLGGPAGAFGGGGDALFMPITAIRYATEDTRVSRSCPGKAIAPASTLLSSSCAWLSVWYLVHTSEDARALAQTLKSQLPQLVPDWRARKLGLLNVRQLLTAADIVPGPVRLYALLGAGFLILCIINAAGMQLSRGLRGTSQIGIRRALGASRLEIIKQYLCDALLVSGLGGMLGVGLTFAGLYGVRHLRGVYYAWTLPCSA